MQGWPLTGIQQFRFVEGFYHFLKRVIHCAKTLQTIWLMLITTLFVGLGFLCMWGRGSLPDQSPGKVSDTECLMNVTGSRHCTCVVESHCWDPLGENPGKLAPSFLQIHPCVFSLSWFCFVSFCCNNHSCEEDHKLGPVSPPTESLNLGGLGDPGTVLPFRLHPPPPSCCPPASLIS